MPETRAALRPPDDEARALARRLLSGARHGALGVLDPASGAPLVTRVALVPGPDGTPLTLVSDLAAHTAALRADPRASLLVGEPGARGDPLAHPRLTLALRAAFVAPDDTARPTLRAAFLAGQPKAKLYIDFADFHLVRLAVLSAALNGGFGRAFALTPADLGLP